MATNTLQSFSHEYFGQIRTIEHDGTVLFCGRDVAVALGYENPSKAIRDHARQDGGPKRYPIYYRLIGENTIPDLDQRVRPLLFDYVQ